MFIILRHENIKVKVSGLWSLVFGLSLLLILAMPSFAFADTLDSGGGPKTDFYDSLGEPLPIGLSTDGNGTMGSGYIYTLIFPRAANLRISLASGKLVLSWSGEGNQFEVLYANSYIADPKLLLTPVIVSGMTWKDPDTVPQRYYMVRAAENAKYAPETVGKYTISLLAGKNRISLPLNTAVIDNLPYISTSTELLAQVSGATSLKRFNPSTQALESDFAVASGEAYEVTVSAPTNLVIAGEVYTAANYPTFILKKPTDKTGANWIGLPIKGPLPYTLTLNKASLLATSINSTGDPTDKINALTWWDPANQRTRGWIKAGANWVGVNFDIGADTGIEVNTTYDGVTWQP